MGIKITMSGTRAWELAVGETFTFGRSGDCTACLDPADAGISRLAGSLRHDHGTWWLENNSSSRPLTVLDDLGLPHRLGPGKRAAVEVPTAVIVVGSQGRRHTLRIEPTDAVARVTARSADDGVPTSVGEEVSITESERLAMVALFAAYLEEQPRDTPRPRSYEAAAQRLGSTAATVRKRIEYLRGRLTKVGVPDLTGPDALIHLAEFALSRGLISRADLAALRH